MLDATQLPLSDDSVRLRPLGEADAGAYADGTADADVQDFAHLPEKNYTPDSVLAMIQDQVRPGLERGDLAVLAIAAGLTDEFAGSLVLFDVSEESVEVGFWLHPERRGSGFASAALGLAAQFAAQSGIARLTARTDVRNLASQRVLERAGFTLDGSETDSAPSGEQVEVRFYSRSLQS